MCILQKLAENDVLVGYRDIDVEKSIDSWFEDREIQEFIEKLEKKSNKTRLTSKFQAQSKFNKDSLQNSENQALGIEQNILMKILYLGLEELRKKMKRRVFKKPTLRK